MSNQALPRPRFNAPDPERGPTERGSKAPLKIEARKTPVLEGKVSEIPDVVFGYAMRLCGVAVVALLGLIVYQLAVGSQLSWHAFGWKFFAQSDAPAKLVALKHLPSDYEQRDFVEKGSWATATVSAAPNYQLVSECTKRILAGNPA